jgi:C1A family cysteine protease
MEETMAHKVPHYGWVPDVPDHRDFLYAAPAPRLRALPRRVDLRPQCPPIYDQGGLGSCTANAIAGAIEFDRLKQGQKDFMPSRLFIYYNERVLEGTVGTDAGAQLRDGIRSVARRGDCPEKEWPYIISKFTEKPPAKCYKHALRYRAVEYSRVARTPSQMKGCLADGFPFVFGIAVYVSFESPEVTRTGDVPLPGPGEPGAGDDGRPAGHAMMVVGYDDGKRHFIIRNSWGTRWGVKGYGTIPYSYLVDEDLADDFWTIRVVG